MPAPMDGDLDAPLLGNADWQESQGQGHGNSLLRRSLTFDRDGHMLSKDWNSQNLKAPPTFPETLSEDHESDEEEGGTEHVVHGHGVAVSTTSFVVTVLSLAKTIMGSGMLVLPLAFQLLGCGLGCGLMVLVGSATWFTVYGLVYAAEKMNKATYAAVVRTACGRPAKWGLLAAIFANCLGMCVVFLVIYADILVGSEPEFDGLLRDLMPSLQAGDWLLNRTAVVGMVILCLLLPFSAQHDLARLGPVAMLGVGSVGVFAASTVLLWVAAALQGKTYPLPWLPDWEALSGSTSPDTPSNGWEHLHTGVDALSQGRSTFQWTLNALGQGSGEKSIGAQWASTVMSIAAVMPLLLNADICHQSVFPAMSLLRPYRRKTFNHATATALLMCNLLYTVIALASLATFGPGLQANVLSNMTTSGMAPLLGPYCARCIALLVRLSYFVSLLGSFVFTFAPLRHCVLEVFLGSNFPIKRQAKADRLFLPLTVLLLASIFFIAATAPGIWLVLSLVSSSTSTVMGFIFPGLVILTYARKVKLSHSIKRSVAVALIFLGLFLFVAGFSVLL